ncbi:MAG: ecotin family protein [Desulfococcaceae bacterium]
MKNGFWGILATIFLFPGLAFAESRGAEAFPPAEAGTNRFVIALPEKGVDETRNYRVELIAGRTMETDGVNTYRLTSRIEERNLEGWGYAYYEVTGPGHAAGTMMAAPEGAEPVERFVSGPPLLIRYNSRLPVVVYAPEGYELRYRIWEAGEETYAAREG